CRRQAGGHRHLLHEFARRTPRAAMGGRVRHPGLRHRIHGGLVDAAHDRPRPGPHHRLGPHVPGGEVMNDFDLVIRNAHCATAADVFDADIGIKDGKIAALGQGLPAGREEIDAAGRWVLPGGIDGHCHLDQPMGDNSVMADDFLSGTRSAACGGTTTVLPFACQFKGQSLRDAVDDYHRRADGKATIDYAFHLIVSDPTPDVLDRELPELIREGYTSFKIYMTYDDMKLDDRQIID